MERMALVEVRELTARGWTVDGWFAHGEGDAAFKEWALASGVAVQANSVVRSVLEPVRPWSSVWQLSRAIRHTGARIVNIHYSGGHISLKDVLAVRLAGARCIATVHHPVPWEQSGKRKRLLTWLAGMGCASVLVHSKAVRAVVAATGMTPSKIHRVPPGVEVPASRGLSKEDARATLGLPAGAFVVGCAARLVPHKRVDQLIEAVARTSREGRRTVLVVLGDGPERERLERLAGAIAPGDVRFLGHVLGEPSEFWASLDAFALPSVEEGFGLVFLEAALRGVPSVGAAVGGVPEAILHGDTGLLIPPDDADALTEALFRLRDDEGLRQRLGAAGRARAREQFSERAMGDRLEAVLQAGRPARLAGPKG
ncbi:MAG TPA: glycosyltransferase family 4 protein [Tepidiformaceae bacterium]|nr:glycosyltransferase family 4 protein [Tepidiformaceae bacterium]